MKAIWVALVVVILLPNAAIRLVAQQSEAAHKNFEELKGKAEIGDSKAQYFIGLHYLLVTKNGIEGCAWLRKASEQGHEDAQALLALTLSSGGYPIGLGSDFPAAKVEKDVREASKWYLRAAWQGNGEAQLAIGEMYGAGEGVIQDFIEAYRWLNIAAASSNRWEWANFTNAISQENIAAVKQVFLSVADRARVARDGLAQLMTVDQIAAGQRLSREFKARISPKPGASLSASDIPNASPEASGTGFFITENGFLVTNEHVVRNTAQIRLATSSGLLSANVVKMDAANDLALLKAEGRFTALPVAASRTVKLGGTVTTVGFPNIGLQGFAPKFARGEIASLSGAQDDARYFQISVPVQPGNSGGALVDERGNVVGVVSARLSDAAALRVSGSLPQNVNYAVKSSYLLGFLESVPEVSAKLKEPETKERKFEEVVKAAEQAAVLVLVY